MCLDHVRAFKSNDNLIHRKIDHRGMPSPGELRGHRGELVITH